MPVHVVCKVESLAMRGLLALWLLNMQLLFPPENCADWLYSLFMATELVKNFWCKMEMVLPISAGHVQVDSKTTQDSIQYL